MRLLEHARRSSFLRHNGVLFVGAAAVGALNYLYYPVLGRLLDTTAFGEVQTLISLFLQVTIFLTVLGLVTTNVVTNYDSAEQRNAVVLEFEKLALYLGLAVFLVAILFGGGLAHFLHFSSRTPFILLMAALVASVPFTFRTAFLRGKQRFGLSSIANLIGAGGKLVFAVIFVALGLGTAGAIGGLLAAQIVACFFAAAWAGQAGLHRPAEHRILRLPSFRVLAPELRYGLFVLVASLVVTLQYSIDIILVKHYFDPHTAGLYAGIASVARIIFFLTASIGLVLMSSVRLNAPSDHNRKLGLKSLGLLFGVGLPVVLLCMVNPHRVVGVLMGQTYQDMAYLLPRLAIAIFVISILNIIVSYYVALRRYAIAPVLVVGAGLTYGLMVLNHSSPEAIVNSLLIGSLSLLGLVCLWIASRGIKEYLWQKN